MTAILLLPLALQALLMLIDEVFFHRARHLPRWERIGHPLDTLSVLACFAWVVLVPYGDGARNAYVALALFSTLLVTKDEFVHKTYCSATEHWLHALLFILHPVVLFALAIAWRGLGEAQGTAMATSPAVAFAIRAQLAATTGFFFYQVLYWNIPWKLSAPRDVT